MSPPPPLADIRASHAPAVVILGNDAILAARPATPVQLAHACLAAGFRAVVPGSWGDELVAEATLTALSAQSNRPAIHCACPHVAHRVLAVGSDLASHLVSLVAPPVATARYLRLNTSDELRVTYVGRCPAAADDAIDARFTPEELLAQLVDRGIDLSAQPEVFESVIPPDRRRHLSLPGGIPSPDMLWARARCAVATMDDSEFAAQLAELLLGGSDTLIDAAPIVGCACTGSVRGDDAEPRAAVIALEPPRSAMPVVEETKGLHLEMDLPAAARSPADFVADAPSPPARAAQHVLDGPAEALGEAPPSPPATRNRRPRLTPPGIAAVAAAPVAAPGSSLSPRRRSPVGVARVVPGSVPFGSDSEGRILPRAYVAHRRSPRAGIPVITGITTSPAPAPPSQGLPDAQRLTARQVPDGAIVSAPATHLDSSAKPIAPAPGRQHPGPPAAPMHSERVPAPPAPRSEPLRDIVPPHDEPVAARHESERPVARSVEPASSRPAEASAENALPPQATAVTPDVRQPPPGHAPAAVTRWSALLGAGPERVRRNPRAVLAAALAAVGLLLGVAIGYSAGRRGGDQSRAAAGRSDPGIDSRGDMTVPRSSGARESVSAGGIAPAQNEAGRAAARAPARAPGSAGRVGGRTVSPRRTVRREVAAAAVTPAVVTPPSPTVASRPAELPDTALERARRDSLSRAESLRAERDAIRREIEIRRARVDSIERTRGRLDSLRRADQPNEPPPDR